MTSLRVRRPVLASVGAALASVALAVQVMRRVPQRRPGRRRSGRAGRLPGGVPEGTAWFRAVFRPVPAADRGQQGHRGRGDRPRAQPRPDRKAIEAAYRLPVNRNSRQIVAISIAFHTPNWPDT